MRGGRLLAAVAIVVAIFVTGLIGRLTAPDHNSSPGITSAPDETRTVAGVPVGYARTRAGAVAAMAAYGQALSDPRVQLDDRRRDEVASAVGTERYARSLRDAAGVFAARRAGAVGRALRPGARSVFLGVPIAFRILEYDGSTAVVKSWGVAVVASDTGLSPEASWGTTITTAVWERDDWKVDEVRSLTGPVPAGAGTPSSAGSFLSALEGMSTLRHAP
jgi:hypothetical protein